VDTESLIRLVSPVPLQYRNNLIDDPFRGERFCGRSSYGVSPHLHPAPNPFHERRQSRFVSVVLDALRTGWQSIHAHAGDAVPDERCPGADADHGTTCEKNFL
jgi:hypothetical protein